MAAEMPFEFGWCYQPDGAGEQQCQALLIGDPEAVPFLDIEIQNILDDKTIEILPRQEFSLADSVNYHFALKFSPGILAAPENIDIVDDQHWAIAIDTEQNPDTVYLLWQGPEPIILQPSEVADLVLGRVAAGRDGTETSVNISWQLDQFIEISYRPGEGDYETTTDIALQMIKSTGKTNLPLFVGFVGSNRVLNVNNETSALKLRLTNTSLPGVADANITFTTNSKLLVILEVGSEAEVPWALAREDLVNGVGMSIDGWRQVGEVEQINVDGKTVALQWTFSPQSDVSLQPQQTIVVDIENVKTDHPIGQANLYLRYQLVEGYQDGQFVCQIEKAPLVFADNNVVVCTSAMAEQGNLYMGSTTRQMLNLYEQEYGVGVQADTLYFRSNKHFAWYQQGEHNDTKFDPGSGNVQMVLNQEGNVGIGTANPSSKLEVNGNTRLNSLDVSQDVNVQGKTSTQQLVANDSPLKILSNGEDTTSSLSWVELLGADNDGALALGGKEIRFFSNSTSSEYGTQRLRLYPNGDFDVSESLNVNGSLNADGPLNVNESLNVNGTPIKRIVTGSINKYGGKISGSGFSSEREEQGQFLITLESPFSGDEYIVLATTHDHNPLYCAAIQKMTAGSITIRIRYLNNHESRDGDFSFIAIDPSES